MDRGRGRPPALQSEGPPQSKKYLGRRADWASAGGSASHRVERPSEGRRAPRFYDSLSSTTRIPKGRVTAADRATVSKLTCLLVFYWCERVETARSPLGWVEVTGS